MICTAGSVMHGSLSQLHDTLGWLNPLTSERISPKLSTQYAIKLLFSCHGARVSPLID